MNQAKVIAIVVAYFPDSHIIVETLQSIYKQVSQVLIIDNTPNGSNVLRNLKLLRENNNIKIITLNENTGIAHAQNVGIRKALNDKADFIFLSDQDTFYPSNYMDEMLKAYYKLNDREKVAAITPSVSNVNCEGRKQAFIQFNGIFNKRIYFQNGCHEITEVMASGMIIPSRVFNDIGFMNEELFIDWVDLEWGWRARVRGYKLIGCNDVVISHHAGEEAIKIGWHLFTIRPPIRYYYIIRNMIHLALRSKYITFGRRVNLCIKSVKCIVGYTVFGKPHWKYLVYSLKGFYHGLIKQLGPYK
jgi:rhamnosyltransferase